jgi:hypothetical protein
MTQQEFDALEVGDIVIHATGQTYLVTGNYGDHVAAVRTVDMTNPQEWKVLSKAQHLHKIN